MYYIPTYLSPYWLVGCNTQSSPVYNYGRTIEFGRRNARHGIIVHRIIHTSLHHYNNVSSDQGTTTYNQICTEDGERKRIDVDACLFWSTLDKRTTDLDINIRTSGGPFKMPSVAQLNKSGRFVISSNTMILCQCHWSCCSAGPL